MVEKSCFLGIRRDGKKFSGAMFLGTEHKCKETNGLRCDVPGANWLESAETGFNWRELAETGFNWRELAGIGAN